MYVCDSSETFKASKVSSSLKLNEYIKICFINLHWTSLHVYVYDSSETLKASKVPTSLKFNEQTSVSFHELKLKVMTTQK